MKIISSIHNEQLKYLAKLLSKSKFRHQSGQTILEGIHLLQSYLLAGFQPKQVYLSTDKLVQPEIVHLLSQLPTELVTQVDSSLLAKITSLTKAEGILTLIDIPKSKALPYSDDCIVLERIQDPGNVGTILRSVAAAGIKNIIISPDSADVWSPKVLRSGMGAHFLLQLHHQIDLNQWQSCYTGQILATSLNHSHYHHLYELNLQQPSAWIFGNEGNGISQSLLSNAKCVKIPMLGATESLNVAMAATICVFEQMRQRLSN